MAVNTSHSLADAKSKNDLCRQLAVVAIILLICSPYPGVFGDVALRLVDLSLIGVFVAFLLVALVISDGRIPSIGVLLVGVTGLIVWEIAVTLTSDTSLSYVRDIQDIYKQVFWLTALLLGAALGQAVTDASFQRGLEVAFVVSAFMAAVQFILGPSWFYYAFSVRGVSEVHQHYSSRVIGTLGNPNYFSLFNVAAFYWALTNSMISRQFKYKIYVLTALVMIMLAQSRTNVVCLLVLSIPFSWIVFRAEWTSSTHKTLFVRYIVFVMIVIAASVWWMVRYDAFHYLSSGFITVYKSGLLEQSSFGGRIKFWVYFWDLVKERPVTGYGPSKGFFKYAVADNNYLFIAFKYGFVGLFLTMLIWSYLLIKAARSAFRSGAGSAMFLTFLVLGILFTSAFAETMDSMRLAPLAFLLSGFVLAHPTWADRSVRVGLFHKIVA